MKRNTTHASSRPSDPRERVERPRHDRDFSTSLRSGRNDAVAVMSHSEAETEKIAARFAKTLHGGGTILLTGELGAGKTVFVRGLARGLGIRGRITSPTFVMMRVYRAASAKLQASSAWRRHRSKCRRLGACSCQLVARFVHVDAYRVRGARELEAIGLDEWIGRPDTVVAIEWGERVRPIPRGTRTWSVRLMSDPHAPDYRRILILHSRVHRRT